MAERLRLAFCRQPFELAAGALDVTISLGTALAEPAEVGDEGHTLVERADAGLYQAKREGRNRVARG